MERGFLAREYARAPRVETTRDSEPSLDSEPEGDGSLLQSDIDDFSPGASQENVAFFDHDAFEPDYGVLPKKRDSFSKLEDLLREESPKKRFRPTPVKSPSPPSSMFRALELEPRPQYKVFPATNTPRTKRKAERPKIQILRTKNRGNPNDSLRQATLTKYLPIRKTQGSGKIADGTACEEKQPSPPPFPGLFTNASTRSPKPLEPPQSDAMRQRLPDDFVVYIKLEPAEERFLARFKYMFDSAAKKISYAPPFPVGLQPFQSSMLEVQVDSTTSQSEHLILQQALCAGRGADQVFWGETAKMSRETPEWARLPTSLPGTFFKKLSEFLLHKSILIVVPGASLNDLCRVSEKLRSLGIPTKYTSEKVPWDSVDASEVWLVSYGQCPEDIPRNRFDGVILPQGASKWSGLSCGRLHIDFDPDFSNLAPRRTVFVDCRLEELSKRLNKIDDMETDSKPLYRHGVDLCSGDLGVIFSHENLADAAEQGPVTRFIRRVLRAASLFRFLVVLCVSKNGSIDRLKELTRFVEAKGIQSDCRIQVVDTRGAPVEETIKHFCDVKGDDLADFAFLTLRNSTLASIIDEGNPDQTPHATLVAALL